jgi:predicted flap endonuclease-1-like 5' DNA nuclease
MITGFCNNRTEMAGETKATRQEFVANITRMVDDFKQKNAALRAEFAADISGARQAWSEVSPSSSMAETKVDREENETFVPPAKKDPVSKEAATNRTEEKPGFKQPKDPIAAASKKEILKTEENIVRDDLTQIKGIGVGRETQLNNGGIYTFAQLANCTIDKLNEIFGAEGAQLVPMDKLLEKARNLTK